jgi:predicted transcriptional regulator
MSVKIHSGFRLDQDTCANIAAIAKVERKTKSEVVRQALRSYIEHVQKI